jgi:membrane protein YqaA with SNARE-associated domain
MLSILFFSAWSILRRWGGVGLLLLGILDSSLIPTFGSLDALTAVLAARHKDLWLYYALMSTLGSLAGAYSTYRIGYRAGRAGLERRFGAVRFERVQHSFERWGFGAIFVPAVVPPPFPTTLFFVGAGAFEYPVRKYLGAVLLGRSVRYATIAFIAARFSRQVLRFFRHPERYVTTTLTITIAVILAAVMIALLWKYAQDDSESPG